MAMDQQRMWELHAGNDPENFERPALAPAPQLPPNFFPACIHLHPTFPTPSLYLPCTCFTDSAQPCGQCLQVHAPRLHLCVSSEQDRRSGSGRGRHRHRVSARFSIKSFCMCPLWHDQWIKAQSACVWWHFLATSI